MNESAAVKLVVACGLERADLRLINSAPRHGLYPAWQYLLLSYQIQRCPKTGSEVFGNIWTLICAQIESYLNIPEYSTSTGCARPAAALQEYRTHAYAQVPEQNDLLLLTFESSSADIW